MVFYHSNISLTPYYIDFNNNLYSQINNQSKTFFLDFPILNKEALIEYLNYYRIEQIIVNYLYDFEFISLPNNILTISFNNLSSFNKSLNNLPSQLIKLELGDQFNQHLDYLPPTLQELIIGDSFNQKIDNLPISLQKLELGKSFNQEINNLPNQLHTLKLNIQFNQSIDNLPDSLRYLTIIGCFNQEIKKLPYNLIFLDLCFTRFNYNLIPLNNLTKFSKLIINMENDYLAQISKNAKYEIIYWNGTKYLSGKNLKSK